MCIRDSVNAVEHPDGTLTESEKRTGVWAWKHPHQADGTVTYTKLAGDVVFHDVDFGYTPEKIVLHNIDLYATPGQKIAFVGSTGAGKTTISQTVVVGEGATSDANKVTVSVNRKTVNEGIYLSLIHI